MRAVFFGYSRARDTSHSIEMWIERAGLRVSYSCDFVWGDVPHPYAFDGDPDFLFNFSPVIIKPEQLAKVKVAAINFHTGPPRWPGRGSCSMALLNGDTQFGVTAHLMTASVDAGPILDVIYFPITIQLLAPKELHDETLAQIPELAKRVIDELRRNDWQRPHPSGEVWERKAVTKAEFDTAMEIKEDDYFEHKMQAFAYPGKRGPYIVIKGRRFWYGGDE